MTFLELHSKLNKTVIIIMYRVMHKEWPPSNKFVQQAGFLQYFCPFWQNVIGDKQGGHFFDHLKVSAVLIHKI